MSLPATVQQNAALPTIGGAASFVDRYLSSLDVKDKTRETYRKGLKNFMSWIQDSNVVNPSRQDVLEYKKHLLAKYSACTVSGYLTAVKGFFAFLAAEYGTPNVSAGIKGAKMSRGFRKDALSVQQAQGLLASFDRSTAEGRRDYAIVNLLLRTGLRTIEIVRANVGDIRKEAGQPVLYIQGKGRDSKDAFVVLTESTLTPINECLKDRKEKGEQAPLFASLSDRNAGERMTTRSISRIAKNALIAAGLEDDRLTAHSLRHTAVTLALIAGATLQEAQALARHSSINTTMIYAHNINRIANAPENKLDQLLSASA